MKRVGECRGKLEAFAEREVGGARTAACSLYQIEKQLSHLGYWVLSKEVLIAVELHKPTAARASTGIPRQRLSHRRSTV